MTAIQDGEVLYRYANPHVFPAGQTELPLSIFNDALLSCDWQRLKAAPEASLHVAHGRNMIVSISICDAIRNPANPKRVGVQVPEWRQEIVHDPLPPTEADPFTPNASHALIKGAKKGAVTTAIRENSRYYIVPPPVVT